MKKVEKDDSYSHILKYTGIFGGVQGLNILIAVVRNKLVAMILGPGGMGLLSLFNSTIKLVSDSTNLGISMSAVREIAEAYESGDEAKVSHIIKLIRVWSLLTALLGGLLCVALSPLLSRWTFSWGNHTWHFVLLSVVVAFTAVTGGELAILKGVRQLRHLAVISVYGVLGALVTSIPLYLVWGEAAIVPSLIVIALLQMLFTVFYSYRLYPLCLEHSRRLLGEGMGMVRLGIAFVLAGILGSGAEFVIRSYLNNVGDLEAVGLYNAGYMMTVTYAGMVFQAMETDYFPRLSAVKGVGEQLNLVVNRQIEVSLLLISPLLVFFMVCAPILLPLLYSGKFLPVMGMMKITVLSMYFRAITLPIEYVSLAKGRSWVYLFTEAVYDVFIVFAVILGYHYLGLAGTGIGIVLAGLFNLVFVLVLTFKVYRYHLSSNVIAYSLVLMPLGLVAYLITFLTTGVVYWVAGGLINLVCLGYSLHVLRTKAHLWNSLTQKVKMRLPWNKKRMLH